jgi:hypothetical protein
MTNFMLRHEACVQNKDLMMRLLLQMQTITKQAQSSHWTSD